MTTLSLRNTKTTQSIFDLLTTCARLSASHRSGDPNFRKLGVKLSEESGIEGSDDEEVGTREIDIVARTGDLNAILKAISELKPNAIILDINLSNVREVARVVE